MHNEFTADPNHDYKYKLSIENYHIKHKTLQFVQKSFLFYTIKNGEELKLIYRPNGTDMWHIWKHDEDFKIQNR